MPNEKRKNKTAREDVTGSVLQSPHRTTGRKRQEKRIASGNQRRGQARSANEAERGESTRRPGYEATAAALADEHPASAR